MGSRIRHKTGKRKKRQERKIRLNLQLKFREVGRKNFKAAKLPRYWQKSHALAEKFQARYNKNARIKMLAGEGKRANMGKTDPEKAIVIEGRRGKQTGNE